MAIEKQKEGEINGIKKEGIVYNVRFSKRQEVIGCRTDEGLASDKKGKITSILWERKKKLGPEAGKWVR